MTVIKSIRIDEELLTKAEDWAEYAGLSFNKLAEMAIKQYLIRAMQIREESE